MQVRVRSEDAVSKPAVLGRRVDHWIIVATGDAINKVLMVAPVCVFGREDEGKAGTRRRFGVWGGDERGVEVWMTVWLEDALDVVFVVAPVYDLKSKAGKGRGST